MASVSSASAHVAQVSIDLLEIGGLPEAYESDKDSAYVLLLRVMGEVRQSTPTQTAAASEGCMELLGQRFDFETAFDEGWDLGDLRSFLANEKVRIDVFCVPLGDSSSWKLTDLGAKRVAAYGICPWPWVRTSGSLLCSSCDMLGTPRIRQHASQSAAVRKEQNPWVCLRLRSSIRLEPVRSCGGMGLCLPKSGDVFEVPRWTDSPAGDPGDRGSSPRHAPEVLTSSGGRQAHRHQACSGVVGGVGRARAGSAPGVRRRPRGA
eukprot:gnl/TRDRNA2_/TRDRNA2_82697_c0_seq1.p1 gnl/TRDRNA2_/TRDRNA2_82697_c0~~gnl/TRDRNA2_/TRDRNA2_82697_c0_seq1.p1  ORF type:complete len:263 (+),score=21.31 gnl/TRDRNA2_/TRDRNA2_82697_c0_seq1:115-903(+)